MSLSRKISNSVKFLIVKRRLLGSIVLCLIIAPSAMRSGLNFRSRPTSRVTEFCVNLWVYKNTFFSFLFCVRGATSTTFNVRPYQYLAHKHLIHLFSRPIIWLCISIILHGYIKSYAYCERVYELFPSSIYSGTIRQNVVVDKHAQNQIS